MSAIRIISERNLLAVARKRPHYLILARKQSQELVLARPGYFALIACQRNISTTSKVCTVTPPPSMPIQPEQSGRTTSHVKHQQKGAEEAATITIDRLAEMDEPYKATDTDPVKEAQNLEREARLRERHAYLRRDKDQNEVAFHSSDSDFVPGEVGVGFYGR